MLLSIVFVLLAICLVGLVLSRRGLYAEPIAVPRLLDGFQGLGGSSGDYSVVLVDVGKQKIQFIRAVRMLTGVGLTQAKSFADHPGSAIERVSRDVGERVVMALQAAGATVQLKGPDA